MSKMLIDTYLYLYILIYVYSYSYSNLYILILIYTHTPHTYIHTHTHTHKHTFTRTLPHTHTNTHTHTHVNTLSPPLPIKPTLSMLLYVFNPLYLWYTYVFNSHAEVTDIAQRQWHPYMETGTPPPIYTNVYLTPFISTTICNKPSLSTLIYVLNPLYAMLLYAPIP
jgi:hypothetical protein